VTPDDFFDSDWEETGGTQETAVTRPSGGAPDPEAGPPPRRPRAEPRAEHTPRRRPSIGQLKTGNLPPLQYRRLGALAVGILAVVVVLVLLARGCSGSSSQSKNVDYFNTLKEQALTPSSDISSAFHKTLNSASGTKLKVVQQQFQSQAAAMSKAAEAAASIPPTKQLEPYQPALVQALQYRVFGLRCLASNIGQAWKRKRPAAVGRSLAPCTQRLLASDIVYSDSFAGPATKALKGLGVQVPVSSFLDVKDADLVTPVGIGAAITRLKPSAVHGLHGLGIVSVVALPQGTTLQTGSSQVNELTGNDKLVIVVSARNFGNFREVGVPVTLTLTRAGSAKITQSGTIASIDKGATATVRFPDLFKNASTQPEFTQRYKMTVTVKGVPGESVLANNKRIYLVQFRLAT
jgi:hypothetical protein